MPCYRGLRLGRALKPPSKFNVTFKLHGRVVATTTIDQSGRIQACEWNNDVTGPVLLDVIITRGCTTVAAFQHRMTKTFFPIMVDMDFEVRNVPEEAVDVFSWDNKGQKMGLYGISDGYSGFFHMI